MGNLSKASASYKRWNLSTSYQPGILFPINISGNKLIWSNWVKSSQIYIYRKIELVFEPEYVVTHWGSCLYTAVANTRHKSYFQSAICEIWTHFQRMWCISNGWCMMQQIQKQKHHTYNTKAKPSVTYTNKKHKWSSKKANTPMCTMCIGQCTLPHALYIYKTQMKQQKSKNTNAKHKCYMHIAPCLLYMHCTVKGVT